MLNLCFFGRYGVWGWKDSRLSSPGEHGLHGESLGMHTSSDPLRKQSIVPRSLKLTFLFCCVFSGVMYQSIFSYAGHNPIIIIQLILMFLL